MQYIAHIRESDQEIQTVAEHLYETRQLAEVYGDKIGIRHITGLAGMLHDLGKYTEKFQNYIRLAVQNPDNPPKRGSVDHSSAGGKLLYTLFHIQPQGTFDKQDVFIKYVLTEVVANAIISHHSYLQDFLNPQLESRFLYRVRDLDIEGFEDVVVLFYKHVMDKSTFFDYVNQATAELDQYMKREGEVDFELKLMYLSKFVFSALIDADRTNTRCFEENKSAGDKTKVEPMHHQKLFHEYYEKLMMHVKSLQAVMPIHLLIYLEKKCPNNVSNLQKDLLEYIRSLSLQAVVKHSPVFVMP